MINQEVIIKFQINLSNYQVSLDNFIDDHLFQILEEQYSNLKYRLPLIEKSNNELFSKLSNFSKLLNSNDEYIKVIWQ